MARVRSAERLLEVRLLRRVEREALLGLGVLAHRVEVHAPHALDEAAPARRRARARPRRAAGACGSRRPPGAGAGRGTCRPPRRAGARARAAARAAPSRGSRARTAMPSTRARSSLSAPSRSSSAPRSSSNASRARESSACASLARSRAPCRSSLCFIEGADVSPKAAAFCDELLLEAPPAPRSSSALRARRASVPRAAESFSRTPAVVTLHAVTTCRCASSCSRASASAASALAERRPGQLHHRRGLPPAPAAASARSNAGLLDGARQLLLLGRELPRVRRTIPSSCSSAFCRSFSAVTSASSPACASLAREVEGRARLGQLHARGLEHLEPVRRPPRRAAGSPRPARAPRACCRGSPRPPRRPARPRSGRRRGARCRRASRARRARPPPRRRRARGQVAHDEGVAHERVHERLVFGREAQRVAQARDDAPHPPARGSRAPAT